MYRCFKKIAGVGNGNNIYYWKSKGLPEERILLQCLTIVLLET